MLDHSKPLLFVDHIRGRVRGPVRYTSRGAPIWSVEVVNVKTERVLADDDAFSFADAVQDAAERAHIARFAWFYGFARKALR